ncbi:MAG: pyridoxamine 5'-phosphate oxidase family protein [Acidimicrobiales bacterium]
MSKSEDDKRSVVSLLTEDRQGLEVIPYEECKDLLREAGIGRIGFLDQGETIILPVNFAFVSGSILFRSAPGSKLSSAEIAKPMSFEIDGWEESTRTGWSVLVKGVSDLVTDEWLTGMYEFLGSEPWADSIPRDNWIRIRADEISGRRIV